MPWLALTVQVEREAAEALSDALLQAGAQSVWFEAPGKVSALLSQQQDPEALVATAARAAGIAAPKFTRETLA